MKALWTLMTVALAVGFTACASTTAANRQPTMEEMAAQLTALREQNVALQEQVAHLQAPAHDDAESEEEAVERTAGMQLPRRPPVRPEDMVPPPAQQRRLPPQNWAWLHQPPAGCTSGIYSMQAENWTDHHVQLFIDGEEIRVRGSRGILPGIPPHETVYLCLNNTGEHTFTGMLFALRYGQPQRVGRFRYQDHWDGASLWGPGRQKVIIRPAYVTWE